VGIVRPARPGQQPRPQRLDDRAVLRHHESGCLRSTGPAWPIFHRLCGRSIWYASGTTAATVADRD